MPSGIVAQAGLWNTLTSDVNVFLTLLILLATVLGGFSTKASVAGFSGFLVFTKIGSETDLFIWTGALYLVIGVLLIVMAVRFWGFVTGGELDS